MILPLHFTNTMRVQSVCTSLWTNFLRMEMLVAMILEVLLTFTIEKGFVISSSKCTPHILVNLGTTGPVEITPCLALQLGLWHSWMLQKPFPELKLLLCPTIL